MSDAAETPHAAQNTQEHERLKLSPNSGTAWRRWGPYVSERSWGTVREDYSANGNAWDFLTHEHRARRPIAGAKTGWLESATDINC